MSRAPAEPRHGREPAGWEARSPRDRTCRRPVHAEPPASDASWDPALQRGWSPRPGLGSGSPLLPPVSFPVCCSVTFSVFLSVVFPYSLCLSPSLHHLCLALPGSVCLSVSLSPPPSLVFLSLCAPFCLLVFVPLCLPHSFVLCHLEADLLFLVSLPCPLSQSLRPSVSSFPFLCGLRISPCPLRVRISDTRRRSLGSCPV